MFRNFISFCLFLSIFSLCNLSFAETIIPSEEAHKLYAAANQLEESKRFEEAKALYQQVLQQYPNSPFAAGAKLHFSRFDISSRIAAGNKATLDTEVNKTMTDLAGHPDMPWFIYCLANQYEENKDYEKAKAYYQKVLQQYPNSSVAAGAKLHFSRFSVLSQIASSNRTVFENEITNIESNFQNHPDFPWYIYGVANQYEERKRDEEAKNIYRKILQKYPGSPVATGAKLHLARFEIGSMIDSADEDAADLAINKLAESFPNHPDMPYFLSEMANHYNAAAQNEAFGKSGEYSRKAAVLYETAAKKADPNIAPLMLCVAAECHQRSGDYKKTIDCYLKVIQDYPDFSGVWHAQFMVGRTYENMLGAGLISEAEAKPLIASAYKQIQTKYPNCKAAGAARCMSAKYDASAIGEVSEISDSNNVK